MYPHLLKIQITIMLLVATANCLLASSIGDPYMACFSVFAVVIGFLVVDRFELIDLTGWLANIVLIGVLYFTMKDFIGGSSSGKLLSVANLLGYLQLTLYFQKKTPRLCWQLVVLGILQVVLAAIFNLNFEHFLFFILYFALATASLFLLHDYLHWNRTVTENQRNFDFAKTQRTDPQTQPATLSPMLVLSKPVQNRNLPHSGWMLLPWLAVSVIFAMILFHSLPHSRQTWKAATSRKFGGTGKSLSVDLDVEGRVPISNQLHFRAKFSDLDSGKQLIVDGQPYFRGMALSKLNLEKNVTSWVAPYDHVFDWSYDKLPSLYENDELNDFVRPVDLEIILEPVNDPLLYATTPMFKQQNGESDVQFCRDISALTRRQAEVTNNIASYVYNVVTLLDKKKRPLEGWPYVPFRYGSDFPAMETGSPEYELHTQIDRPRYRELMAIADSIAAESNTQNPLDLSNALLSHFSESNRYQYTLDYRNVSRDKSLDPVEDFVRNHRQGHCSMYASALTLMLRSQGIPARYVSGFYGGNYNNLTDCYVIHGRHAHAWVEAYIPPENCTQEMFDRRTAHPSTGMWLLLDPTPPSDATGSNDAFDLARSIWQDYVISPDTNKQSFSSNNTLLRKSARDTVLGNYADATVEIIKQDRRTQLFLVTGFLLMLILGSLRNRSFIKRSQNDDSKSATSRYWQTLYSRAITAIGYVAPPLANWLERQTRSASVPFYARFEKVLSKHLDLRRSPAQTQNEFAQAAMTKISAYSNEPVVIETAENVLRTVTDAFYQARFSTTPLDKSAVHKIENQILNLEDIVKRFNSRSK